MRRSRLRESLSANSEQSVLFAADIRSQPAGDALGARDPFLHHQCERALPIAEQEDIVVLQGPLDEYYHQWLRSLDLSTDHIVAYGERRASGPLASLIRQNPAPVRKMLNDSTAPVYLPFYPSEEDLLCAKELGIPVLGCDEATTTKYFDKLSFKQECERIGVTTIEGHHHDIDVTSPLNEEEMGELIHRLLTNYEKVIVRGTDGAGGTSAYTVGSSDIKTLYEQLIASEDQTVLIEPFLNVISSPNDQWAINNGGEIHHLGLSAQLFQGLKHAGNFFGQYYSPRVTKYIEENSLKIVQAMAEGGYRGVLGIDYIVCEEGIFPIENNARMNGSTFALELFNIARERIDGLHCWKFYKARCEKSDFPQFQKKVQKFLYDGEKRNSLFPFMT
ncbi:hypothetical protein MRY87_00350, partial [bacterium]|nr:hypothetical protein [bacterium]